MLIRGMLLTFLRAFDVAGNVLIIKKLSLLKMPASTWNWNIAFLNVDATNYQNILLTLIQVG